MKLGEKLQNNREQWLSHKTAGSMLEKETLTDAERGELSIARDFFVAVVMDVTLCVNNNTCPDSLNFPNRLEKATPAEVNDFFSIANKFGCSREGTYPDWLDLLHVRPAFQQFLGWCINQRLCAVWSFNPDDSGTMGWSMKIEPNFSK